MTITSTAPTVDKNGISVPQFSDILDFLKTKYRSIYGDDVYLENDSQDGQFLAIIAASINDANAAAVAVYNSFSPANAVGTGLDRNVKINGISRGEETKSTVVVTITGIVGTSINSGVVGDGENSWDLPASVTIPTAGSIDVTATCQKSGAITADAGAVTIISTPAYGWQTVYNGAAATPGRAIESDAALRVKQAASVALPSMTVLEGITSAVEATSGSPNVKAYENDTSTVDDQGIPPSSIAIVVDGGYSTDIAGAIALKKGPGARTYGTTSVSVLDQYGIPQIIKFSPVNRVPIQVRLTIKALAGYTSSTSETIKDALVAHVSALDIGEDVVIPRLYVPAQLSGSAESETYRVSSLTASKTTGTPDSLDIQMAYNERATLDSASVTIVVA